MPALLSLLSSNLLHALLVQVNIDLHHDNHHHHDHDHDHDNQNEGVWRPPASHRNFSFYREALHSYTGDDGDHDGDLYYDHCDGEDDGGGDDIYL